MSRRVFALALAAAACGGKYKAPPAVPQIDLPSGAALTPYPGKTAAARPQVMAELYGKIYVTIGNYDDLGVPTGPGMLASFVPSTGQAALIDLGGDDHRQCQDTAFVRASGSRLFVSCGGDYTSGSGQAILEVDPGGTVVHALAVPQSPGGVAVFPNRVWFGDNTTSQVHAIDRATWQIAGAAVTLACGDIGYAYVPEVANVGGELYAICSGSKGGVLFRLDPESGAIRSQLLVGALPQELVDTGDGRIAVANAGDNTLSLVTPGPTSLTGEVGLRFASGNQALQDVRARNGYLYTVQSASNTAQKIDLQAQGGPRVIAEASLGENASPWNILPLDDDQAIVSNNRKNSIVRVVW